MEKLGIYIHIPFCARKCDYCDFLSAPADKSTMESYVRALVWEIELSRRKMEGYLVDTVFVGGGTPSILEEDLLCEVINTLKSNCNIEKSAEITVECNPGTVTEKKLLTYKNAGVNRLSFGLQSANNEELKALGRIHTYEEFQKSYGYARKCGFDNINVDIMSALPRQREASYKETLEKVISLAPEHISAYSLMVEKGTKLYDIVEKSRAKGENILPDEDLERKMYYMTKTMLEKAGYDRYEISNYSKDGYECRHNMGYWKRKSYLGFGISAASLYKEERHNNISDINLYIKEMTREERELNKIEENIQRLSREEQIEEFMFLGLRMTSGISVRQFENQFGEKYEKIYGAVSQKLEEKGLLERDGAYVKLSERGIDISNYVMSEFLF